MKRLLKIFLAAIVGVGCSSTNNPEDILQSDVDNPILVNIEQNNETELTELIQDRQWVLVAYIDDSGMQSNVTQETQFQFTMQLSSIPQPFPSLDGEIVTSIGGINVCNAYGGAYVVQNNILGTRAISTDSADCERDSEEPSRIFGTVLFNSPILSLDGEMLVLTAGTNESLIFREGDSVAFTEILSDDLASLGNFVFTEPRFQAFRDQRNLEIFYSSLIQCPCIRPAPPLVDFEISTVLFVANEIVGSGGFDIEIADVFIQPDQLIVEIQSYVPGVNCAVAAVTAGPFRFYTIDGIHENVFFIERPVIVESCD